MTDILATWTGAARAPTPPCRRTARGPAGYGVFRCADGWIALSGITEQHFWTATCDGLGLDDVRELPLLDQMERSEELSGRIADACAGSPAPTRSPGSPPPARR